MHGIARDWARAHGSELGFSMGRFCPKLIGRQRVFLILQDGCPRGFVTFLTGHDGWHLDLIRYRSGLSDGAIHMAVVAAIGAAHTECIAQLSLACVPDPQSTPAVWANRRGLSQFKRSFAPVWVGRYHCAPNRIAFWLSGFFIALAVQRPVANLPLRLLHVIKLLPLELKFMPKRDKRRLQHNQRPQKS